MKLLSMVGYVEFIHNNLFGDFFDTWNANVNEFIWHTNQTIEDMIAYKLILTKSAINQLNQ